MEVVQVSFPQGVGYNVQPERACDRRSPMPSQSPPVAAMRPRQADLLGLADDGPHELMGNGCQLEETQDRGQAAALVLRPASSHGDRKGERLAGVPVSLLRPGRMSRMSKFSFFPTWPRTK